MRVPSGSLTRCRGEHSVSARRRGSEEKHEDDEHHDHRDGDPVERLPIHPLLHRVPPPSIFLLARCLALGLAEDEDGQEDERGNGGRRVRRSPVHAMPSSLMVPDTSPAYTR